MEEATSRNGFSIAEAKIPILLTLRKTEDLRPHEETVQEDLDGIVRALRVDPVLRHPIIADSKTGAVLDGTHRLAALKQLGCSRIPAALIDYQNPLVRVDRWFRTVKGRHSVDFRKRIETLSPVHMPNAEADQSLLARTSYATLQSSQDCLVFKTNDSGPLALYRHSFALERTARDALAKVGYTDKNNMNELSPTTTLMSTILLEKKEVVESCINRQLFPPKSTRHLIPSRPLGIIVPLEWLRNPNEAEAEKQFEKHLANKTIRLLPEGSVVGSRRYMEEVILFE